MNIFALRSDILRFCFSPDFCIISFMSEPKNSEFRVIAEGFYETVEEAKHALIDPFIEDFVEKHGKFKFHQADDIYVASGIALSDLSIAEIDEGVFEISCRDSPQVLNARRAAQLVEKLERQSMFDELRVEPVE
jgi:hypothetical protein